MILVFSLLCVVFTLALLGIAARIIAWKGLFDSLSEQWLVATGALWRPTAAMVKTIKDNVGKGEVIAFAVSPAISTIWNREYSNLVHFCTQRACSVV